MSQFRRLTDAYIRKWINQGYPDGIPDEVPAGLMRDQLAPSYRELCIAILKNDPGMIGAVIPSSRWYSELKRIEIMQRNGGVGVVPPTIEEQLKLGFLYPKVE